ncbi:DUF1489 domain-containing protein [Allosphingosinicella flava]|uniref:DUF1489 domain-containing protein n=1 Tax=Allosphingosinicella flava TaxID=2771430 RepID=A0A7T2GIX5_9SPHN|nr:DUF1489 domain-containing protein [Sphingosinicella flava]QPQ54694.1 DUF1489 domain-containing protein [Sphingosinicella flava]
MNPLHISKVAVACSGFDALRSRQAARIENGIVSVVTRYKPKRAEELIGGSLFWIIKHRLIARQTILGFAETEEGRAIIRVDASLVPVKARPKRAHQGWRYLTAADAPADLGSGDGIADLPAMLAGKLAGLALI